MEARNAFIEDDHWDPAFYGKELLGVSAASMKREKPHAIFYLLNWKIYFKKLMTLNPRDQGRLKEIIQDLWLNMGQEEELRPYNEQPCDDVDLGVTEELMNLGFEWDQIQDSLKSKRYNSTMAMYLTLSTKKPTRAGCTIFVRPFGSLDLNSHGPSPTEEVSQRSPGSVRQISSLRSRNQDLPVPHPAWIKNRQSSPKPPM